MHPRAGHRSIPQCFSAALVALTLFSCASGNPPPPNPPAAAQHSASAAAPADESCDAACCACQHGNAKQGPCNLCAACKGKCSPPATAPLCVLGAHEPANPTLALFVASLHHTKRTGGKIPNDDDISQATYQFWQ